MCDICGCERLSEGGTDPGFLFLSDQLHSPQLAIVKLTLKTATLDISLWQLHLRVYSSYDVAVLGLLHIYIHIFCHQDLTDLELGVEKGHHVQV